MLLFGASRFGKRALDFAVIMYTSNTMRALMTELLTRCKFIFLLYFSLTLEMK